MSDTEGLKEKNKALKIGSKALKGKHNLMMGLINMKPELIELLGNNHAIVKKVTKLINDNI